MMQIIIELMLNNESEKFFVEADSVVSDLPCICQIPIKFSYNLMVFVISTMGFHDAMLRLFDVVAKALDNELVLHDSITKNIGYMYNQLVYQEQQEVLFPTDSCIVYEQAEDVSWVGIRHAIFGGNGWLVWIYNNGAGEIVIEINGLYREESFSSPSFDHQKFYEWMKNYKPFLVRILSQKRAQEWLKNVQVLLREIDIAYKKRSQC